MNAIVAVNADWGIGLCGKQTVVIPEDRRHFKKLTDNCAVIIGRKTFESLGGPLPNRSCILLTHDLSNKTENAVVVNSLTEALAAAQGYNSEKVFVIGGESIYRQILPFCVFAYVTKINVCPLSDAFFPDLDSLPGWEPMFVGEKNESGGVWFSYNIYRNNLAEPF